MTKDINQITNDVLLIYSYGYSCYYFRNTQSLFVSLQDYETSDKAMAEFKTDKVVWVEDVKSAIT